MVSPFFSIILDRDLGRHMFVAIPLLPIILYFS